MFHRGLFLPFFLMGTRECYRRRSPWGTIVLVWFLGYMLVLGLANTFVHEWYLDPLLMVYVIVSGVGVAAVSRVGIVYELKKQAFYRSVVLAIAFAFFVANGVMAYQKTSW